MSDISLGETDGKSFVDGVLATYGELKEVSKAVLQQQMELQQRPSVLYKPTVSQDGDRWVALYGPDLATGVVGCGKTPAEAMEDFDAAWCMSAKTAKATPEKFPGVPQAVVQPPVITIKIEGTPRSGKSTLARLIREAMQAQYGIVCTVYDESPDTLQHIDARLGHIKKKNTKIDIYASRIPGDPQSEAAEEMYVALCRALENAMWESATELQNAERAVMYAEEVFKY